MKLKIKQDDDTISLALERTPLGKEALNTKQPSARERQLLLLLDKDSTIGAQAVSKLLGKVSLFDLADKGWVVYRVLSGDLRTPAAKHDPNQHDGYAEDDTPALPINDFLSIIKTDSSPVLEDLPKPPDTNHATFDGLAITTDSAVDLQSIKIVQALL